MERDERLMIGVPERLEGARVLLRIFEPGDGAAIWEAVEESRAGVIPWQDWPDRHRQPRDSEREARRLRHAFLGRDYLYYAIVERSSGRFLGWAGIEDIDWRIPSFSIGCWLRSPAWGHGLMSDALSLLLDLCFGPLKARRVAYLAESGNRRSVALARRLGFVFEGELRNHRVGAGGEACATLVFSLTPGDPRTSEIR